MLLGDLGRHGKGSAYVFLSKRYNQVSQLNTQNYTEDNRTQGIMEKSQWDLKRIRFDGKRLTRLDDFVLIYQRKHDGLLREYGDVVNKRRKSYRVETEKWKKISRKRKGFYVTPQMGKQVKQDYLQEPPDSDVPTEQTEAVTTQSTEDIQGWDLPNNSRKVQEAEKGKTLDKLQVTALWKREETEVVVAVIPSQIKGNNFIVHHSELQSLEPHQWLTGEIIECALHVMACKLDLGSKIYILNHYTAGVILFGKREMMRRHCLSKVNFDNYEAIVSFVNVGNVHWKCLVSSNINCLSENSYSELSSILWNNKISVFKIRFCKCHKMSPWKLFLLSETTSPDLCVCVMSHYQVLNVKYLYTGLLNVSHQFTLKPDI
nr:uncharacterized protein LOC129165268 isoform X1 [Nothobranchius furzeri]